MASEEPNPDEIAGIEEAAKVAAQAAGAHPFRTGFILGGVFTVASVLLIIQNGVKVNLQWLFLDFTWPLWLALLVSFLAGVVAWQFFLYEYHKVTRVASERRAAARKARWAARKLRKQS